MREERCTQRERGGRRDGKVVGKGRRWVRRGAGGEEVKGEEEGKMW